MVGEVFLLEVGDQLSPQANDKVGHDLNFLQLLFLKIQGSQNGWAIWVLLRGGLEHIGWINIFNCNLTLWASSASLQTALKAATYAHVFGIGLAVRTGNALFDGILVNIARGKSLVGYVKEHREILFPHYCCFSSHCSRQGVLSHEIVGTGMQENALLWYFWNALLSACETKPQVLGS